jgi:hypothetical protein
MPQLDQFTYLTQFTWLCIFFMSFYVLLYNDGLPRIATILKIRSASSQNLPKVPSDNSFSLSKITENPDKKNLIIDSLNCLLKRQAPLFGASIKWLNSWEGKNAKNGKLLIQALINHLSGLQAAASLKLLAVTQKTTNSSLKNQSIADHSTILAVLLCSQ